MTKQTRIYDVNVSPGVLESWLRIAVNAAEIASRDKKIGGPVVTKVQPDGDGWLTMFAVAANGLVLGQLAVPPHDWSPTTRRDG